MIKALAFVKNHLVGYAELISVAALIGVVAGFFGRFNYLLDLCSHFRVQACVALLICGLLVFWVSKYRWLGLLPIALGVWLTVTLAPFWWSRADPIKDNSEVLRLLSFNVLTSNMQKAEVGDYLLREAADVVVVLEIDTHWRHALDQKLNSTYPHRMGRTRGDNFGMGVYSKLPFAKPSAIRAIGAEVPTLDLYFKTEEGKDFRLLATHPLPPTTHLHWLSRNQQLQALAEEIGSDLGKPIMVCGDLNITPWSPLMQDFVTASGLDYAAKGFGLKPTWSLFSSILGLPIDHILLSNGFAVHQYRVGPDLGSDHRAIIADFSLVK